MSIHLLHDNIEKDDLKHDSGSLEETKKHRRNGADDRADERNHFHNARQ